jgi:hypothetical protein
LAFFSETFSGSRGMLPLGIDTALSVNEAWLSIAEVVCDATIPGIFRLFSEFVVR